MAYTGPQQSNGNDCGVYTALFCQLTCERVCRHQHEHLSTSTNNNNSQIDTLSLRSLGWLTDLTSAINPTNAYEFRRAMRADVSDATARFGHKRSSELLESIRLSSSSGSSSGQVSDDNSFHGVEFRPLLQSIVEGGVENDEDENNHLEDDVDEYGLDTLPHDV